MISNSTKLKILLFGGNGLIGSRLKQLLKAKYKIIAPSRKSVDVTNESKLSSKIEQVKPNYIIYAAGLTSVDEAEKNPDLAQLLNAHVPDLIAKKAALLNIPMLYFSSDAVFDGTKSDKPYSENDRENPLSEYGKSKLLGEQKIISASSRNCVIRVITVYSHVFFRRKRFVQMALETLKKRGKLYAMTDQVYNPIYVDNIAWVVDLLIKTKSFGIYHLGATDYVTNFEFTKKLARYFNLDENLIVGISFKDFFKEKKAQRTQYCWLDTAKFRNQFGEKILYSIDESIELFKNNLNL